jgi:hypothetical protein
MPVYGSHALLFILQHSAICIYRWYISMSYLNVRLRDDASGQRVMSIRLSASFRGGTVEQAAAAAVKQYVEICQLLPSSGTVTAVLVCAGEYWLTPDQFVKCWAWTKL